MLPQKCSGKCDAALTVAVLICIPKTMRSPPPQVVLLMRCGGFFPKSRKPRAIIVQPTRELALQTIRVVRNFPVRRESESFVIASSSFLLPHLPGQWSVLRAAPLSRISRESFTSCWHLLAPCSDAGDFYRCQETQALFAGVDVVVTTPFRLILHLGKADMVLNEAQDKRHKHVILYSRLLLYRRGPTRGV